MSTDEVGRTSTARAEDVDALRIGAAPPARTVRELLDRAAAARPQTVYAVDAESGQALTFGALAATSRAVAAWLGARGVGRGDTVSIVMPNGLPMLALLLGAMRAGVVVHPVNLLAQPAQMRYVIEHSDARLVVASAGADADRARAAVADIAANGGRSIDVAAIDGLAAFGAAPASAASAEDDEAPSPAATALLMYTSGTTGLPKGVMLSQAALAANAQAIAAEHALGEDDRVLAVLPLYHINGFVVTMLAPLASGGSLALAPRFSAERFWRQAIDRRCTWLNVVPTIVSYLLEGGAPAAGELAAIRFCRSASAPLPREHLVAFEQRFGIDVIETMGLTETAAPSFSNGRARGERRLGSVGRASGGRACVIDPSGTPVADGTSGEIAIRGAHVMRGYYKNDEATRAAFTADGWLRTGDLGHRDADGFFFVTGRIKELIIKGGENIAPREIDDVLLAHPAVADAAAVGVPDRHYGQEILACVVVREGAACDEEALRAWCVERLGRYKTPRAFRFVEALPRGPSGKVQRLKLLEAAPT